MRVDKRLISRCVKQERKAQKALYQLLLPYLTGVCKRYLRNPSDLHDALQDSFVNVFRAVETYDESKAEFHTWATRITINCTLKLNQRLYKVETNELIEESALISHIPCVLDQLNDEDLLAYLKRMPASFLEVFNLHLVDGYSHKEIADMLDIHESLSRQRLSRAKKWVKERMTEQGEEIERIENRI